MTKAETPNQDDINEIWDCKLDGCSVRYIHECKVTHLSRHAIARVLKGPVPEQFKDDERLLPYRYTWISAGGLQSATEVSAAFIILKFDRKITQSSYRKGIRNIKRDVESFSPIGWIQPHVTEPIEEKIARKFVLKHGYHAWEIDLHGGVRRLSADDFEVAPPPSVGLQMRQ